MHTRSSELHRLAEEALRNARRAAAWRLKRAAQAYMATAGRRSPAAIIIEESAHDHRRL